MRKEREREREWRKTYRSIFHPSSQERDAYLLRALCWRMLENGVKNSKKRSAYERAVVVAEVS
jgi:hypothetical protein